jgi:hypothetical protein
MSWQRIDENTYVDDTLVTCAEYQLFIDEMREQGKYYQPDHWTSYQFSAGQAREPILGVRHSDAIAFCEWLTQREKGNWKYRLLSSSEALNYPMPTMDQQPLGYWNEEVSRFSWVGGIPSDPRSISGGMNLPNPLFRAIGRVLGYHPDRVFNFSSPLDMDHDRVIARKLDVVIAHAFDPDLRFEVNRLSEQATGAERLREIMDRSSDPDIFEKDPPNDNDVFILLFDLFTLRERTAGSSPAFEGIRLVKERIK